MRAEIDELVGLPRESSELQLTNPIATLDATTRAWIGVTKVWRYCTPTGSRSE